MLQVGRALQNLCQGESVAETLRATRRNCQEEEQTAWAETGLWSTAEERLAELTTAWVKKGGGLNWSVCGMLVIVRRKTGGCPRKTLALSLEWNSQ